MSLRDDLLEIVWTETEGILPDNAATNAKLFVIIGAVTMRRAWPTMSLADCALNFGEFVREVATYGDPEYDWSVGAARELAHECMREMAE